MYENPPRSCTISVIIPVYNVREYLTDCLQSVSSQTYQNLEIILVDDGSTDGSGQVCDLWAQDDSRIRVLHQENAGVSEARNAGIEASTGNYIGFIDADDWIEPDMYQKLLNSIIQNRTDIAMSGYFDYPNGMDHGVSKGIIPFPVSDYHDAVIPVLQRNGYFTSIWNKLYTREAIFRQEGPVLLDPSLAYGEDEAWFFRVFSKCRKVSFVTEPLYHWRPRKESTTRTIQIMDKHLSLLSAKKQILDFLPNDASIQRLARGRVFNDCHILKVYAYLSNQAKYYKDIKRQLSPYKYDWLTSNDVTLARKTKVMILDLLMTFKAPRTIIQRISQTR